MIGFVGLIVPHIARRAVGHDVRLALPSAALLGAAVLPLTDAMSRTLFAPGRDPAERLAGVRRRPDVPLSPRSSGGTTAMGFVSVEAVSPRSANDLAAT